MFQSSPVPKDGCNAAISGLWHRARVVSILTRPEGRVQRIAEIQAMPPAEFQSSPVPKDGCNMNHRAYGEVADFVSILTRPEGRVQHFRRAEGRQPPTVSILTRPEGRVQHGHRLQKRGAVRFNPHPSRRTGATFTWTSPLHVLEVSILTRPEGRVQPLPTKTTHRLPVFQSSPVPKDGCNTR